LLDIALKQRLDLEKETRTIAATSGRSDLVPQVDPARPHALEIDKHSPELTQVVVSIGYNQWLQDNGLGIPSERILKPLHNGGSRATHLTRHSDGTAAEPERLKADIAASDLRGYCSFRLAPGPRRPSGRREPGRP
jgi:hypothetical protein